MNLEDIQPGMSVLYVPGHAHGDVKHPDCEHGIVSSKNDVNVFVRYYKNGMMQHVAQATSPGDLEKP